MLWLDGDEKAGGVARFENFEKLARADSAGWPANPKPPKPTESEPAGKVA